MTGLAMIIELSVIEMVVIIGVSCFFGAAVTVWVAYVLNRRRGGGEPAAVVQAAPQRKVLSEKERARIAAEMERLVSRQAVLREQIARFDGITVEGNTHKSEPDPKGVLMGASAGLAKPAANPTPPSARAKGTAVVEPQPTPLPDGTKCRGCGSEALVEEDPPRLTRNGKTLHVAICADCQKKNIIWS